jgi:hypothetical protein
MITNKKYTFLINIVKNIHKIFCNIYVIINNVIIFYHLNVLNVINKIKYIINMNVKK